MKIDMPAPPSFSHVRGYRRDIDGLRAVAVLPVLMFHLDVPGFSGGFIGVDIFFVISGYLLTSIILDEWADGRFSIAGFYERRARRILPALVVLLALVSVACSLLFSPLQNYDYAQSVFATAVFASNALFAMRLDYFAGITAETRPLLHTWSLAVEEQFYVLLPFLMLALLRWAPKRMPLVLAGLGVASFLLSVEFTAAQPEIAFYHLPFRMWELLAGCWLATRPPPRAPSFRSATTTGVLGLTLIALAVTLYDQYLPFPGIGAVAPVLGAALIIRAGDHGSHPVSRLLSSRPLVGIGLISYSLYLWHWPPIVLSQLYLFRFLTGAERVSIFLFAVLMASLSWRFVERPFRDSARFSRWKIFGLGAAALAVFACGALVALFHLSGTAVAIQDTRFAAVESMRQGPCHLDSDQLIADWAGPIRCGAGTGAPRILLWGDSHAAQLMPGIRDLAARGAGIHIVQVSKTSCPPVLGFVFRFQPACTQFNSEVASMLARERFDQVILAANWEEYPLADRMDLMQDTIDVIRRRGVRVTVVLQSPRFFFDDPVIYESRYGSVVAEIRPRTVITAQVASLHGVDFFDPEEAICRQERCTIRDRRGYLFFDGHHLSLNGSRLMACALVRTRLPLRWLRACGLPRPVSSHD
ncbi:MAG: acyltransferase [Alphaproteobacteria bacterium]|nr:MAG: acyltransferase [Alphaproteobacteria bacterium]